MVVYNKAVKNTMNLVNYMGNIDEISDNQSHVKICKKVIVLFGHMSNAERHPIRSSRYTR